MDTHLFVSASVPTSVDFHGELALVVYRCVSAVRLAFSRSHVAIIYGIWVMRCAHQPLHDPCARVSRVCPGSPRSLFTGAPSFNSQTGVGVGPLYKHEK